VISPGPLYSHLVEAWLDRQHGWRLALIVWGLLCPFAVAVGDGLWVLFVQGSRMPWFTLPDVIAYSVVVSLALAAVAIFARRALRRRGALFLALYERTERDREKLRWTMIGVLLIWTALTLDVFAEQTGWYAHRIVGLVSSLLILPGLVCLLVGKFRARRSGPVPGQATTRP